MKKLEKIQLIIESVAREYEVETNALIDKGRRASIAQARCLAMAMCYEQTTATLSEIGSIFGGRDHSTVLHAVKLKQQREKANETENILIKLIEKQEHGIS